MKVTQQIVKSIKPKFNEFLVTMDKYETDQYSEGGVVNIPAGTMKEYQTVVKVGNAVREVKPGDIVWINPKNYAIYGHDEEPKYTDPSGQKVQPYGHKKLKGYNFRIIELGNEPYMILVESDIDYIVEELEDIEFNIPDPTDLYVPPAKSLILT